jgi:hypothetical protein
MQITTDGFGATGAVVRKSRELFKCYFWVSAVISLFSCVWFGKQLKQFGNYLNNFENLLKAVRMYLAYVIITVTH